MAGLERVTGPAVEPLGLAEARLHLRLDSDEEDALVTALIRAAREMAERYTGRTLASQGLRLWLDQWPAGRRAVALPCPPLVAITGVTVYDADDLPHSFDGWLADRVATPGRLVLRAGVAAPRPGRVANGIAIDFEAGYGSDVPQAIRRGMALLLGHLFEQRDTGQASVPSTVEALWAPYRVMRL